MSTEAAKTAKKGEEERLAREAEEAAELPRRQRKNILRVRQQKLARRRDEQKRNDWLPRPRGSRERLKKKGLAREAAKAAETAKKAAGKLLAREKKRCSRDEETTRRGTALA